MTTLYMLRRSAAFFIKVEKLCLFKGMSTSASSRYVGTSQRGLSKDFTFPVPWGEIVGKTWGDETKPPIICLHGWLDNCNTFDKLIPLLPKDYFYIAMDFPGHGFSSPISHGMFYSTTFYCSAIMRLLKRFNLSNATFLGHSMGGNVSTFFSGLYPEITERLIILDQGGIWFKRNEDIASGLRQCIDSYLGYELSDTRPPKKYTYEQARERLKSANQQLCDESVDILLQRGLKELDDGTFTFTRDHRHLYRDLIERNFEGALGVIKNCKADILFIWAKDGQVKQILKKSYGEYFNKAHEVYKEHCNAKYAEVEGKHHMHLCTPEETSTEITKFLQETKDKASAGDSSNL